MESDRLAELRALYDDYLARVAEIEAKQKPGEGLFGLRGGAKDDPCHERFDRDVEAFLTAFAGEEHAPEELRPLLEHIYFAPERKSHARSAYWMLLVVHRLTLPLIGVLTPADAAALAERYDTAYPGRDRLPAQNEVLDALRERAGLEKRKRRRFFFDKEEK